MPLAQDVPPPPTPVPPPAPLIVRAPRLLATGLPIGVRGAGAPPGARVSLQVRTENGWSPVRRRTADAAGRVMFAYRPSRSRPRLRIRLAAPGALPSAARTVRTRDVTLAAFGDANFGDGVQAVMLQRGNRWPWGGVAATLKAADIAFGNLECSISTRGTPEVKEFTFRGSPGALREVVPYAGLDVLNLANNHVGDYGTGALLDTIRNVRSTGALAVGAGTDLTGARAPQVIERLGLKVAFVGFSDIGPTSFAATPDRPGTAFASPQAIRDGVREARRHADVVIVTFHWGVERDPRETARQRGFAADAVSAGASAVIGAHPHVLQPIRRAGAKRLIAYSLGNFVWAAGSPASSRTGILHVRLSANGVEGYHLQRARIVGTRPALG
ncbi:CapA family protein [Capillimicrobium parvum]|uniref:Capsule synthesis protein CapA domain-containing protein n=1 Tax=Capillimicrobium parvum TaxID=2884022 RepID=A0A9E7C1N7_9ACTN|nr:CapA family protein [Capillimicrobium parvum]UGS36884.1 hypothetical protein DSM104329_03295 [Capillimicrobium parvum]